MQIQSYQIHLRLTWQPRRRESGRWNGGRDACKAAARAQTQRRERASPTGFPLRRAPKVLPARRTAHNCGARRGEERMQRRAETRRHGRTASVRACVQSVDNKRIIFFIDFPAALEKGRKVHKSAQRCLEDEKRVRGVAVGGL